MCTLIVTRTLKFFPTRFLDKTLHRKSSLVDQLLNSTIENRGHFSIGNVISGLWSQCKPELTGRMQYIMIKAQPARKRSEIDEKCQLNSEHWEKSAFRLQIFSSLKGACIPIKLIFHQIDRWFYRTAHGKYRTCYQLKVKFALVSVASSGRMVAFDS